LKRVTHDRAKLHRPVLPSSLRVPVVVIRGPHCWYTLLPQLQPLLPAHSSSSWCLSHHYRCFPRSLPASLYELPLLGRPSKQPLHRAVDRQRHWLKVFKYLKHPHLLRNTSSPYLNSRYFPGAYLMAWPVHCHLFPSPCGCRAKH
jgi:hypothetical protein